MMTTVSLSKERQEGGDETEVRVRILDAAFANSWLGLRRRDFSTAVLPNLPNSSAGCCGAI
jgi:hypothetical protein